MTTHTKNLESQINGRYPATLRAHMKFYIIGG